MLRPVMTTKNQRSLPFLIHLTTFTIASLFGKIREHELKMNRLNEQET